MLSRIYCFFDIHKWSAVEVWTNHTEKCCRELSCERCGKIDYQAFQHEWSDWYETRDHSCIYQKVCKRCKAVQFEQRHNWENKIGTSCIGQRVCQKCGTSEPITQHDWGKCICVDSSTHMWHCLKCGEISSGSHSWGSWSAFGSLEHSRSCEDCSASESEGHEWVSSGEEVYSQGGQEIWSYSSTCRACNISATTTQSGTEYSY